MNSQNSKHFNSHILLLKLTDKADFTREEKIVALGNLSICDTYRNI